MYSITYNHVCNYKYISLPTYLDRAMYNISNIANAPSMRHIFNVTYIAQHRVQYCLY